MTPKHTGEISEYIVYATGLVLSILILGGLGLNWLLPHLGISQPLALLPLVIFINAAILTVLLYVYCFNKNFVLSYKLQRPNWKSLLFGTIPWAFIALSVIGSQILNNSGSGLVTLLMLFGIAVYVIALISCRRSVQSWVYISALYSISLSLLLMYSLRSTHILGWDINLEYQVFQTTLQNLVWSMSSHPGLDYNACMSITILPTIIKVLTNMPSEYVFKVAFQVIFATTPVMVYVLARRYLKEGMAFLAAFLFLSQTWFFEQMPALIRQEIAFVFCILIVLVLLDKHLTKSVRYTLFCIFTASLILSHYSTAYVLIALLFTALLISYGIRLFIRPLREQPKIIGPAMFGISLLLLLVWQVPLTHTLNKVTRFVTNDNGQVAATSTPITVNDVVPTSVTPSVVGDLVMSKIEQDAVERSNHQAGNRRYAADLTSGYAPIAIDNRKFVDTNMPHFIAGTIDLLAKASKFVFIVLFPLVGIYGIYMGLRRKGFENEQGFDFMILSTASYALIVLIIITPYLQEYYNFTRLYLQMFLVLSVTSLIGAGMVMKHVPRYKMSILAVAVVFVFCSYTGAFDQISGGQARITMNQPPSTQDTFYTYDTEIAGAKWLATNRISTDPVQADVIANLRLQSYGNLSADNYDILPKTLETDSYVYLIRANISEGRAFIQYKNNLTVYNYPLNFLEDNKDLIYNDGDSRVYK